jgi:YVTN family beta-propeller protein
VTRAKGIISLVVAVPLAAMAGCTDPPPSRVSATGPAQATASPPGSPPPLAAAPRDLIAGMPAYPSTANVYAAAGPGMLSEQVRGDRALVYVPNTKSNDVWVIDPATRRVVDKFPGGPEPQHVVPSYDLRTLYVASSKPPGGGVLPIDPRTGRPGTFRNLEDVYNLYFTPDGGQAIVVAEAYQRLDFYDAKTWRRTRSLSFPTCGGINHMDYSADGRTMLFSCEFANRMLVLDTATGRQLRQFTLTVTPGGMPQDTRLTPDGQHFLVADMRANGVYVFDGNATRQTGFIATGRGAHGIYFGRDGRAAYVTNRDEGSITVLDLDTLRPSATWRLPGGGSPDMGGISADGRTLWLSGRYHNEVYAISLPDGRLLARIPVGDGPHGLTIWPQPGRYSLGHTGNIR